MLERIWRGEISLVWAFWGFGLGGLTFPLAALLFWVMFLPFTLGAQFSEPSFWFANLIFIFLGVIPTTVVWRSASRTISKVWGDMAKVYIFLSISVGLVLSPVVLIGMDIKHRLTPEFYENTPEFRSVAPGFFRKHTGIDIPEGARLAHVAYRRHGTMDYEFSYHVILDAGGMDLEKWISTAEPLGSNLQKIKPEQDLEWNSGGLTCDDLARPEGKFTGPICRLGRGSEVWQAEKRLRLDRVVTLTVLEEDNLIWLLETSW